MDDTIKAELTDQVIALARQIRPDVHIVAKYGGTVFMTDPMVPASLVGGVFGYGAYISVEFSNGAQFSDPDTVLEGKGKARRHVKLRGLGDVKTKDVAGFLAQALA